ncbi:hypothetical protein ACFQH8_10875 [Halomicroarcula sp. GCM10025710]
MAISDEIIDVTEEYDRVSVVENFTHDSLISAAHKANADRILLPISQSYWDIVHQWHDDHEGEYRDGDLHIRAGESELKVHWLPTDRGYESVYLMNSECLSVIQKKYEDTDIPTQIQDRAYPELNNLSRGQHLMNYFAEGETDEIDLLQRVVFWKDLEPEGAFRIEPARTLTEFIS